MSRGRNLLETSKTFIKTNTIQSTRVPLIKTVHAATGIQCDISFKNLLSVKNSEFIAFCLTLDSRIRPLIMTLRIWLKDRFSKIGQLNQVCFNNYAFTMMCFFYLQQLEKPILHSIQTFQMDVTPELVRRSSKALFLDDDVTL